MDVIPPDEPAGSADAQLVTNGMVVAMEIEHMVEQAMSIEEEMLLEAAEIEMIEER